MGLAWKHGRSDKTFENALEIHHGINDPTQIPTSSNIFEVHGLGKHPWKASPASGSTCSVPHERFRHFVVETKARLTSCWDRNPALITNDVQALDSETSKLSKRLAICHYLIKSYKYSKRSVWVQHRKERKRCQRCSNCYWIDITDPFRSFQTWSLAFLPPLLGRGYTTSFPFLCFSHHFPYFPILAVNQNYTAISCSSVLVCSRLFAEVFSPRVLAIARVSLLLQV